MTIASNTHRKDCLMVNATLSAYHDAGTSVSLTANGHHVATYSVARDDGPGPVPAAVAVLERNGWTVSGEWTHESHGVSGDVWIVEAHQRQP